MPLTSSATKLAIFTDLDGCLLNKHDYDWSPAAETLQLLGDRKIPLFMNSSKTVPEMEHLASELGLNGKTFISENGSVIRWGDEEMNQPANTIEIIGAPYEQIVSVLGHLKEQFAFRSFADLGLEGVINETQLPRDKASMAIARQGTAPLIWDDTETNRLAFEESLQSEGLTMTKGGRFWHVAGTSSHGLISKGMAMRIVAERFAKSQLGKTEGNLITAAIGDSPIDQSMLDVADIPIGIPTAAGLGVTVDPECGIVATNQGAVGWTEAVKKLLLRFDTRDSRMAFSPPA